MGASATSYGYNPFTNQFWNGLQPIWLPLTTQCSCMKPLETSRLVCDIYVDLMAGYFWVVNEKGEVVHYVVDCLPTSTESMYFGVVYKQTNVSQISIRTVVNQSTSQKTISSFVKMITEHFRGLLHTERELFRCLALTVNEENSKNLRFYSKKPGYLITFYILLSFIRIARTSNVPFPVILLEGIIRNWTERRRVCTLYPALFNKDLGMVVDLIWLGLV